MKSEVTSEREFYWVCDMKSSHEGLIRVEVVSVIVQIGWIAVVEINRSTIKVSQK